MKDFKRAAELDKILKYWHCYQLPWQVGYQMNSSVCEESHWKKVCFYQAHFIHAL